MRRSGRLAIVLAVAALAVTLGLAGTPAAAKPPGPPKPPAGPKPPPGPPNPHAGLVKLHGVNLDTATVLDLQRDMNKHRFTSAQLTAFYLSRIQQLNPVLHAVIETNPDAMAEATASDMQRKKHHSRGPLDGIPVLLKDNIGTGDQEHTTAGSFALIGDHPADAS